MIHHVVPNLGSYSEKIIKLNGLIVVILNTTIKPFNEKSLKFILYYNTTQYL